MTLTETPQASFHCPLLILLDHIGWLNCHKCKDNVAWRLLFCYKLLIQIQECAFLLSQTKHTQWPSFFAELFCVWDWLLECMVVGPSSCQSCPLGCTHMVSVEASDFPLPTLLTQVHYLRYVNSALRAVVFAWEVRLLRGSRQAMMTPIMKRWLSIDSRCARLWSWKLIWRPKF